MSFIEIEREFLQSLSHIPPKALPAVFAHTTPRAIKAAVELICNRHLLPIKPAQIKRLKKHKRYFHSIENCCNKARQVNINKAKKLLAHKQVGGAFPLLLAAALPFLAKAALAGGVSAASGVAVKKLINS